MSICEICGSQLNPKSKLSKCKKCRHNESCRKWIKNNPDKFSSYQESYRNKNREICNARSRKSYNKKPEEYNKKTRDLYRIKNNLPLDHPRKNKNGEGNIDCQGYKTICKKGHPNAMDNRGRIREHVYVMSQILGRPLSKNESVHHKNGIRDDNRPENLELWSRGQPPGQRVIDKISFYIEFLESHGYKVNKE